MARARRGARARRLRRRSRRDRGTLIVIVDTAGRLDRARSVGRDRARHHRGDRHHGAAGHDGHTGRRIVAIAVGVGLRRRLWCSSRSPEFLLLGGTAGDELRTVAHDDRADGRRLRRRALAVAPGSHAADHGRRGGRRLRARRTDAVRGDARSNSSRSRPLSGWSSSARARCAATRGRAPGRRSDRGSRCSRCRRCCTTSARRSCGAWSRSASSRSRSSSSARSGACRRRSCSARSCCSCTASRSCGRGSRRRTSTCRGGCGSESAAPLLIYLAARYERSMRALRTSFTAVTSLR